MEAARKEFSIQNVFNFFTFEEMLIFKKIKKQLLTQSFSTI
jgi:hypothetical protein